MNTEQMREALQCCIAALLSGGGEAEVHDRCDDEHREGDEAILRQALEALDSDHSDIQLRTAIALRERLGEGEQQ